MCVEISPPQHGTLHSTYFDGVARRAGGYSRSLHAWRVLLPLALFSSSSLLHRDRDSAALSDEVIDEDDPPPCDSAGPSHQRRLRASLGGLSDSTGVHCPSLRRPHGDGKTRMIGFYIQETVLGITVSGEHRNCWRLCFQTTHSKMPIAKRSRIFISFCPYFFIVFIL